MKQDYEHEIMRYAYAAYGFLVEDVRHTTPRQLAKAIQDHYSMDNPQTLEVIRVLCMKGDE